MKKFFVEYECRQLGTIGKFYLVSDTVWADDVQSACETFRKRYAKRFEFRFPSQCYEVKT